MYELAILLPRVLSMSNFSTSLLKISASFSLLHIVLLLLFKIIDSLWKAFSEKRGPTVFRIFYCRRQLYGLVSPKKRLLVSRSKPTHKFLWWLKRLLDSSFLLFKNLFLSFDKFIIAFLRSFVSVWTYIIYFLGRACQE